MFLISNRLYLNLYRTHVIYIVDVVFLLVYTNIMQYINVQQENHTVVSRKKV